MGRIGQELKSVGLSNWMGVIRVRQESRVTSRWLNEWWCHSPREGTEEDNKVSDPLNLSCLWDTGMKMSSKPLGSQILSFEERLGIGN